MYSAEILHLPADLAIVYAAEQNFFVDTQLEIVRPEDWEKHQYDYVAEAMELLMATDKNYCPDSSLPWIHAHSTIYPLDSVRGQRLIALFNYYYNPRIKYRYDMPRPDPKILTDDEKISVSLQLITRLICAH